MPASGQASLAVLRILNEECRCPAPFAAGRETLQQAAQHQQNGSPVPDGGIARDQANGTGGKRHDPDRYDQRCPTSHAVAIGADHDGAHRPHQEGGAKRGIGAVHRAGRIKCTRDGHSEVAVDREVEQLEEIADRAGQDGPPPRHRKLACAQRGMEVGDGLGHDWFLAGGNSGTQSACFMPWRQAGAAATPSAQARWSEPRTVRDTQLNIPWESSLIDRPCLN